MAIRKRTWKTPKGEKRTAWIVDYRDGAGTRRLKTFQRKRDADDWLDQTKTEVKNGTHIPDAQSLTIAEAAANWIAACERGRDGKLPLEPSTLRQYQRHARIITDMIGSRKLNALTRKLPDHRTMLEVFRDDLISQRSRPYAKKILTSFKSILLSGKATAGVYHAARSLKIQSEDEGRFAEEVNMPEPTTVKAILATTTALAEKDKRWRRWRIFIHAAAQTGMRSSELRGLAWKHVDLDEHVIQVRQRADESGCIGRPKTKASRRDIPISSSLVTMLREWYLESGRPRPEALVFATLRGRPESLSNFWNRAWRPMLEEAGVIHFNFHQLRHFHASRLIAAAVTPKELQIELGHGSIKTTYDIYGHLFKDGLKERKDRADRLAAELLP